MIIRASRLIETLTLCGSVAMVFARPASAQGLAGWSNLNQVGTLLNSETNAQSSTSTYNEYSGPWTFDPAASTPITIFPFSPGVSVPPARSPPVSREPMPPDSNPPAVPHSGTAPSVGSNAATSLVSECDIAGEPIDHLAASHDPGPWPSGPFELHDRQFPENFFKRPYFFMLGDRPPEPSPRIAPFSVPLPIPPVLVPDYRDANTEFYQLTVREAKKEIIPGVLTPIWGFDGMYPGPTICIKQGKKAIVRQINHTNIHLSIHRHGGDQPGSMDGHPTDMIMPGAYKDYEYVQPDHRLMWYHDHTMEKTGAHVYHGIAGFYIVENPLEKQFGLPMGKNKIPLAITDKIIGSDGKLVYPVNFQTIMEGVMGDTILVNGAPQPYLEVANRKMRFLVLNSSTARVYELALSNGQPLIQIGTGAGLLQAPEVLSAIELSPSDRADLVIDFSSVPVGEKVILRNLLGSGTTRDIMRFDVVREETDDSVIPERFNEHALLNPSDAAAERTFVFEMDKELNDMNKMWVINGKPFDENEIYARPKLGTTEVWTLINNSGQPHPFHMHLVNFQILSKNYETPADPDLTGTDDESLLLHPGQIVKIIMKWEHFTGKYVLHCHNSEHEDHAMMMQYEVVE